jgi:hypothetical protein
MSSCIQKEPNYLREVREGLGFEDFTRACGTYLGEHFERGIEQSDGYSPELMRPMRLTEASLAPNIWRSSSRRVGITKTDMQHLLLIGQERHNDQQRPTTTNNDQQRPTTQRFQPIQ